MEAGTVMERSYRRFEIPPNRPQTKKGHDDVAFASPSWPKKKPGVD